jgi:hypothetical protein
MANEMSIYVRALQEALDRLVAVTEDLDAERLNWRPPASEANSLWICATHTMGNLRAWVLGIACQQPIGRDRPAEFASSGTDPSTLRSRARELASEFEQALTTLSDATLGEIRQPQQQHWGLGPPHNLSVREALIETIRHAWEHIGEMQLTRTLLQHQGAILPKT